MRVIILGCGGRGRTYARYCAENELEIAGVADPNTAKLEKFGYDYGVDTSRLYTDWREAVANVQAQAVINGTPDRMHYETTITALQKGLHVLLEKPMSPVEAECIEMTELAESKGLLLMVCHVLRYAPFFEKLKDLLDQERIGRLINMEMTENVNYWHFVHSYVRGVFRNEAISSPFILAKSCHDLDLIGYLTNKRCLSVMSEGGLTYYRKENAPEGAPSFCLQNCPHEKTCPHFAPALYMKPITYVGWPAETISVDTSYAARYKALETGNFGRCAFKCDNDVNDHQTAVFRMEDGLTVDFNMIGFSSENTRTLRFFGTKGNIRGHLDQGVLEISDFLTGKKEIIHVDNKTIISSHGGGDSRLLKDFAHAVKSGCYHVKTSARLSLQSHLMAFAAERSRKEGRRIEL